MLRRRAIRLSMDAMAGRNRRRRVAVFAGAVLAIATAVTIPAVVAIGSAHTPTVLFAYVANFGDGTVTPVNLATGRPGAPIKVGNGPEAIAITPDGKTAYVVEPYRGTVIPVNLATGRPGTPTSLYTSRRGIPFLQALDPNVIAITPDGKTAYVVEPYRGTVIPVNLATGRPGAPIQVGNSTPFAIAISPGGRTAYVATLAVPPSTIALVAAGTVIPVNLATGRPGAPIKVGRNPQAIAITPDGKTAYVVDSYDGVIIPVNLATGRPGTPIKVGTDPQAIAITPDGTTAYVASQADGNGDGTVIPVNLATGRTGTPIKVGNSPEAIALTR